MHAAPRDSIHEAYRRLVTLFQHQPSAVRRRASKSAMDGGASALDEARKRARELAEACPPAFYHVAIDCPGYGGSAGSAKTIRSDPLRLLQVSRRLRVRARMRKFRSSLYLPSIFLIYIPYISFASPRT